MKLPHIAVKTEVYDNLPLTNFAAIFPWLPSDAIPASNTAAGLLLTALYHRGEIDRSDIKLSPKFKTDPIPQLRNMRYQFWYIRNVGNKVVLDKRHRGFVDWRSDYEARLEQFSISSGRKPSKYKDLSVIEHYLNQWRKRYA